MSDGQEEDDAVRLITHHPSLITALARSWTQIRSCEEVRNLDGCVFKTVRSMYDILFDASRKVRANCAGCGFLRIGRAHEFTIFCDRIFAFKDLDHDRTGSHVLH